jgi:hypothetical protein
MFVLKTNNVLVDRIGGEKKKEKETIKRYSAMSYRLVMLIVVTER